MKECSILMIMVCNIARNLCCNGREQNFCPQETDSLSDNYREIRRQLFDERIIKAIIFMQDYVFSTVSAAASVVSGSSVNGWIEWKAEDGSSYQEVKNDL